jgi:hypothetical protein
MLDNASSATVARLDIPFNTLACGIVAPQVLLTMSNGGGTVNQSFFIVFYN